MGEMFGEAGPAVGVDTSAPYATASDLTTADDLAEMDLTVKRWHKNGKPLKIRIKALDLDQQEAIDLDALKQHPKTKEWFRSDALYCAATLQHGVIVPKLTKEQAQAMRQRNPNILRGVVQWIWALSALDVDDIEKYANDLANLDGAASPVPADSTNEP
jgi:hypothetical protein